MLAFAETMDSSSALYKEVVEHLDKHGAPGLDKENNELSIIERIDWLAKQCARLYFDRMKNYDRKCFNSPACDGKLEYMQSEVREGEYCPKCGYFMYGRK